MDLGKIILHEEQNQLHSPQWVIEEKVENFVRKVAWTLCVREERGTKVQPVNLTHYSPSERGELSQLKSSAYSDDYSGINP